jgi:LmbE family N-acetylglucosaminyl deacetylase
MFRGILSSVKSVLCIGAHADDIEIGCGGALLTLLQNNPNVKVKWVVLSADETRAAEARDSAEKFLRDAREKQIVVERFRDSYFPYDGSEIKEYFSSLAREFTPDLIFTHRREDLHQDHRLVADLTWNTFRQHLIFEYEIPKYEGDLGSPNVFVPLTESNCQDKIDYLIQSFSSQHSKQWFSSETFWALLRLRGIESGTAAFAEGLYCRKLQVEFS